MLRIDIRGIMTKPYSPGQRILSAVLIMAFVVAMLMGVGPGVMLVNKPKSILGLPWLYAWGLIWYFVHMVIVTTAYFLLWNPSTSDRRSAKGDR